jgi:starch synthase
MAMPAGRSKRRQPAFLRTAHLHPPLLVALCPNAARRALARTGRKLDIVFVSAEVAPWSKTGGLGDVMGSLPRAMAARGHRVMVVTPRYTNEKVDVSRYKGVAALDKTVWTELGGSWHELKYHTTFSDGVDWVFLEHPCYQRAGTPYGTEAGPFTDNLFRFSLLCLAALEAPLNLQLGRDRLGMRMRASY